MSEKQTKKVEQKEVCRFKGVSDSGSPIASVWTRVYDESVRRYFVKKTGQFDLNETIQESKNSADIAILKKQYEVTGQVPVADPSLIHGIDLVGVPQNIHELYDFYNHADEKFKTLPEDLQKAFGGVQGFIKSINSGSVQDIYSGYIQGLFKPKQEQPKQIPPDEVKGE